MKVQFVDTAFESSCSFNLCYHQHPHWICLEIKSVVIIKINNNNNLYIPVTGVAVDLIAQAGAFRGGWSVDGSSERVRSFLSGMNAEESLFTEKIAFSASISSKEMSQFSSVIKTHLQNQKTCK